MPNNYLSVLYKHIIQVENENVGLKAGGTNIVPPPPSLNQKVCVWWGGGGGLPTPVTWCNFFHCIFDRILALTICMH